MSRHAAELPEIPHDRAAWLSFLIAAGWVLLAVILVTCVIIPLAIFNAVDDASRSRTITVRTRRHLL